MIFQDSKKGFTLVELLIGLAIFAIIIPIIAAVTVATTVTSKVNSAQIKLQIEGRRSLDTIVNQAKLASEVLAESNGYETDPDTLIVSIPAIDASDNIIPDNDIVVINYNSTDNTIIQEIFPANGSVRPTGLRTLANSISALEFTYSSYNQSDPDNPSEIACTTADNNKKNKIVFNFIKTAYALAINCPAQDIDLINITITLNQPVGKKAANVTLSDNARLRNK